MNDLLSSFLATAAWRQRPRTAFATLLGALLLSGCSSAPRIYSNANPDADLASYETFGFSNDLGTDKGYQGHSILTTNLIEATRRQMEALGYTYTDRTPDLEVNFYLHTEENVPSSSTPSMSVGMGYYGYRGDMYSAWGGYDTTVSEYTEGTLNVDVVDPARKELVWEGVAVGRLTERARQNVGKAVNQVIGDVFENYPLATRE